MRFFLNLTGIFLQDVSVHKELENLKQAVMKSDDEEDAKKNLILRNTSMLICL